MLLVRNSIENDSINFFSANHYQKIWSLPSNQFLKCMTNLDVSPIWKAISELLLTFSLLDTCSRGNLLFRAVWVFHMKKLSLLI